MEKQETVGENADGNMVIRGECVSACAYLKEQGIQVDLVYIDPPFASGADYAKQVYIRRNPKVAAAIAATAACPAGSKTTPHDLLALGAGGVFDEQRLHPLTSFCVLP